jgi:hypothetical protein
MARRLNDFVLLLVPLGIVSAVVQLDPGNYLQDVARADDYREFRNRAAEGDLTPCPPSRRGKGERMRNAAAFTPSQLPFPSREGGQGVRSLGRYS